MESINIIKGYDKIALVVDPLDHHHPNKTTQKRCNTTTATALTILLTLILAALIVALIHESITEPTESPSPSSPNSVDSLKTICSVTQYPTSCFTSISSLLNNPNPPSKPDPESIFTLSLQVSIKELTNLTSLPKNLLSKSNDHGTESALRDCASLFDDALSQLNKSAELVVVGQGEKALTDEKIGDLNAWISSAMSDQETCLDGLEEMGSTVVDEVRAKVQKSKEYMSNSLAILVNIPNLLHKFGLTMH